MTLGSGQAGVWIVARQFAANGDDWTTGAVHLWGACLQQGADQKAYARTWASQTPHVASCVASGPTIIAAADYTTSLLKTRSTARGPPGRRTLLELPPNGELILAGGSGNSYPLPNSQQPATPPGWAGVLTVKTPAGATLGYLLLYSNP